MPSEKNYRKHSFLLQTTWVLTPEYVDIVDQVISARLMGGKLDASQFEARGSSTASGRTRPYAIVDGVAVIEAVGVMGKRMDMFSAWSGGISTQRLQLLIAEALDDPAVDAIVISVDSPGGAVDGIMQLGQWLTRIRAEKTKPLYCFADGQAASGGYLLAACCDKIFCESPATIGSMAVVACHYDRSVQDANNGVKRTFITSGKYKRMANDAEPLSQEGREYLQYFVDRYHGMFVELVVAGRGKDAETVGNLFADGRVWLAREALELGMIDGIKTLAETIEAARQAAMEDDMTLNEFAAKHPELHQELMAQANAAAKANYDAKLAEMKKVAIDEVAAESNRIFGLYTALHGDAKGKIFMKLSCTGTTAEQIEALGGLGFAREHGTLQAADQVPASTTGQQVLNQLVEGDQAQLKDTGAGGPTDFMGAVDMIVARERDAGRTCTRMAATKLAVREFPQLHEAYLNRQQG